jgi:RNA polymerase sigma-70 factor (ECF subfamily)
MLVDTLLSGLKISSFGTRSSFLDKIRSGNESAWFDFHRRYVKMIHHIGTQRGLSNAECDDLMIEVMLIFWKKMDNFVYDPHRGKFRSYIGRIAELLSLKILRDDRKNPAVELSDEYPADIDSTCMDEWNEYLMDRALEDLRASVDTVTYQAFYMLVFQHRTVAEVSAVTRKSANTIYGIRSRCVKKLKKIIAGYRQFDEETLRSNSHKNILQN